MEIDKLDFQWDSKAPKFIKEINADPDNYKPHTLEAYFEFLSEIKPNRQELEDVKIFEKPFTLIIE